MLYWSIKMKKFIIALLFIFGADNIYAIDERVIDFYFGNGVWNTRNDAEKSRDALEKLLGEINIDAPYTIDLVYNWTEGNMDDVVETLYQLQQAE